MIATKADYVVHWNFDTFHEETFGDFTPCDTPRRAPDYVSASRSAYWDLGDRVVRSSDHWGRVRRSLWLIEGLRARGAPITASCAYDAFARIQRHALFTRATELRRHRRVQAFRERALTLPSHAALALEWLQQFPHAPVFEIAVIAAPAASQPHVLHDGGACFLIAPPAPTRVRMPA